MRLVEKATASLKRGGIPALVVSMCSFIIRYIQRTQSRNALDQQGQETDNNSQKLKINASDRYWFTSINNFGQTLHSQDISPNTINWLVPDFTSYSGGHLTLFRLIQELENLGFHNSIVIEHPYTKRSAEEIDKVINSNYISLDCPISVGYKSMRPAYFTFATNWTTAYLVKNFVSTIHKCYLSQDYEPYFYSQDADCYLAERTYNFGFKTFTGGNWIADTLKEKHGVNASVFNFGVNHNMYAAAAQKVRPDDTRRLLFYARPSTPRRGFELGIIAIEKVLEKHKNVTAIVFGCDLSSFSMHERMHCAGIVPQEKLPELYGTCHAGLAISFTNVSLLPLEFMAAGCAVVSNSGPQVEWLLNNEIATLSNADPDSLSKAIEKILIEDELRAKQIKAGHDFISNLKWSNAAQVIADELMSMQ